MFFRKILILVTFCFTKAFGEYDIQIISDGSTASGIPITFNVTLMLDGRVAPSNKYQFRYIFDGTEDAIQTTAPSVLFNVRTDDLDHRHYDIIFAVDEMFFIVYIEKTNKRTTFEVTNHFKGLMQLVQGPNNTIRENGYVSSDSDTVHNIVISDNDKKLYEKAAYIRVYWFIDCLYIGMTESVNFTNWYRNENGKYTIEALMMLSFEPLPVPTSTTTQKPTTTTPTTTSSTTTTTSTTSTTPTTTPTTTTSTTTTKALPKKVKRDTSNQRFEWNLNTLIETGSIKPDNIAFENMTEPSLSTTTEMPVEARIKLLRESSIPYFGVCTNDSKVILDPKKIYGYYQRNITVENPIGNVTVSNNVWLKHDQLCTLYIKFSGTGPFNYCTKYEEGNNSTGVEQSTEECHSDEWKTTDTKELTYTHFFPKASNFYSLFVFIKNEVSTTQSKIGVQFYDAQAHSQLSVIIVPIVFCLMAVVLIVFGVAYYVQNKNQFLVEVADFNFGETQSVDSLEYKSFFQRLLDSVSDLFIKHHYIEDSDVGSGENSRNYSAMP